MDEEGRKVPIYHAAAAETEPEALVPFTTLARLLAWETVLDEEGNADAYSVIAAGYALHFTYGRDEAGQVVQIAIQADSLPVELLPGQAVVIEEELLLSTSALETIMGAQWSLSPDGLTLSITFPPKDSDMSTSGISG